MRSAGRIAGRSERTGTEGAIMVLGVFMATFLVGMLYFVKGIGAAIIHREMMQDAADAATFAAAVMDARGMNIIVFINIIMAAVLAVLVALRVIQLLCIGGIALCAALAWPTFGASLAGIPPLASLESSVTSIYNAVYNPIMQVLRLAHGAEVALKDGVPLLAEARAALAVPEAYSPPGYIGFVYPLARPLPLEDAPFSVLCDHAADMVTDVVMLPFNATIGRIPVIGSRITSFIRGAVHGVARAAAVTVCGGTSSVPDFGIDTSRVLPESPSMHDCTHPAAGADVHAACDQAQTDTQEARFNGDGNCVDNDPAGARRSSCIARENNAVGVCRPGGGRMVDRWTYQVMNLSYTVTKNADGSITRTPPVPDPTLTPNVHLQSTDRGGRPLCGVGGTLSTTYGSSGSICEPTQDTRESSYNIPGLMPGVSTTVRYLRVTQVLQCYGQPDDLDTTFTGMAVSGDNRSPQQVKSTVNLGDEDFQVRGFVIGDNGYHQDDRGVQVASFGHDAGNIYAALAQAGRLSVAQAEFYYDGSEGRDAWMWNMKWRARLRRVRMPRGLDGNALSSACGSSSGAGSGGSACSGGGLDLSAFEGVIVH